MIGIVLPSIGFVMTDHASHPQKLGDIILSEDSSDKKQSQLWLCIGDHEDVVSKDPAIFDTSSLQMGDEAGDHQMNRLTGIAPATSFPCLRQIPVKREIP
jgi:hypothetical protein